MRRHPKSYAMWQDNPAQDSSSQLEANGSGASGRFRNGSPLIRFVSNQVEDLELRKLRVRNFFSLQG